jgi:SAM-dependent methyltransferase
MIAEHESVVAARFDALHGRFKRVLADDDPRLAGVVDHLGPVAGRHILDLGCGKGRFSRALDELGASVVGLDLSTAMLDGATGIDRVRASARRLPFGPASFDGVVAVEVFEHLASRSVDDVCAEICRVLRPGGRLVIVDKNACSWNAQRPWLPSIAVKWIDERRGLWMYSHREKVRERWFRAGALKRRLLRWFPSVRVQYLLSRAEIGRMPFQHVPGTRLFVLWAAQAAGGHT